MPSPLAIAVALALLSGGALAQKRETRARSSVNGLYAIRFVEEAKGRCRVEVQKDQAVVWTLERCVATVDDLLFVDRDGRRFWVIRGLPEIPRRKKGERRPPHLRAQVATLYEPDGRVLKRIYLSQLLERHRTGLLRSLDRHFKWLEGVFDVPGKAPRLNDKNQVELEPVTSKTVRLEFP